ncbi:MAG: hypothetical protein ACAH65_03850 [Chloroflexota bacterium]
MIRDAVLHLTSEQPMIADLFELPAAADVGLRCTNLRTLDGKRPVFVDDKDAVFFFPYLHIRFVEIPPAAVAGELDLPMPAVAGVRATGAVAAVPEVEEDLEIDEDFLRRVREA